ncbi:GHKL domain-containing protein [Vagococcus sp.]|uniref:GHKL domain-containing protein n=1 Tax=Vagococcus sp. TaxID=1933889 RepID=UPI003F9B1D0C
MLVLPNIPRELTALAEWLACVILILQLPKNQHKKNIPFYLIIMGIGQLFLQLLVGTWSLLFWLPGMLLNLGWMFLTLKWTTHYSSNQTLYLVAKGFILAELTASLTWQLYCYLAINLGQFSTLFIYLFAIFCYLLLFTIYYFFSNRLTINAHFIQQIQHRDVFISCLTALMIFFVSNVGFILSNTDFPIGDSLTIYTFRALINLAGLLIILMQENFRSEMMLKEELNAIQHMFQSQYEQYENYREGNELIHRKFHDLKHQIEMIQLETNQEKQKNYIENLKEDLRLFQSPIKTGNAIMDTILTRKNMFCIQNDITLTCFTNGKLLDPIETMDLCSLLGNSLDNAIESILKTPEKEKRLIQLKTVEKGNFIIYQVKNYTENQPEMIDGLPQSTKENTDYHGYGLKSIAYFAEKYNGSMTINYQDNWFILTVLIPKKPTN